MLAFLFRCYHLRTHPLAPAEVGSTPLQGHAAQYQRVTLPFVQLKSWSLTAVHHVHLTRACVGKRGFSHRLSFRFYDLAATRALVRMRRMCTQSLGRNVSLVFCVFGGSCARRRLQGGQVVCGGHKVGEFSQEQVDAGQEEVSSVSRLVLPSPLLFTPLLASPRVPRSSSKSSGSTMPFRFFRTSAGKFTKRYSSLFLRCFSSHRSLSFDPKKTCTF